MLQLARHFPDVRAARPMAVPWRGWGAATLRLGLINGLRLAEPQFLLLLTGLFASIESVGLLRIAQRGAALASIGVSIAVIVAAPEFARLNGAGQRDRLQRLLTRVARAGALASGAGVLLVLGAGHWILGSFFGPEFVAAWTALLILASAEMVRAVFGPAAVLLNMLRHEGVTALALCLSATASAVVAWVLIPSIDASGAALGSLFGVTLASVLLWWHGRRAVALETSVLGPTTLPRKP